MPLMMSQCAPTERDKNTLHDLQVCILGSSQPGMGHLNSFAYLLGKLLLALGSSQCYQISEAAAGSLGTGQPHCGPESWKNHLRRTAGSTACNCGHCHHCHQSAWPPGLLRTSPAGWPLLWTPLPGPTNTPTFPRQNHKKQSNLDS